MMTFFTMLFLHVIADFNLQGILASLKTKKYWEENTKDPLYACDYLTALVVHGYAWSFMIMLPIAYKMSFDVGILFTIVLEANVIIHCIVDDLKANKHKINLLLDQFIHFLQIAVTFAIFLFEVI